MRAQRGVGLVELLVAIAIGLLLMLGLGTMFVSMKQTATLRQNMSALQNNERMAMMFLDSSIHGAGYYPNPVSSVPATVFPVDGSFAAGQPLSGTGAGAGADTLSVRFVAANGGNQGCSTTLTLNDMYKDVFSITGGYLTCTETDPAASTTVTVNLIAGLTGMNILYGVDISGDGSVDEYLPANSVATWAGVKTVNITLIFANPLAGQPGQPATVSLAQTIPYMNGL